MSASFVVYIDESGDEGFRFDEGSPHWFILSAVVTHKESDLNTVKVVEYVRASVLKRTDDSPLHFRKLKHEHRIPFLHEIMQADLKAFVILIHKPSITNIKPFQHRSSLYFHALGLLLEQVSLYCRDQIADTVSGAGSAEINLSNRGGLKSSELRQYLNQLKQFAGNMEVKIDWDIVKLDQIKLHSSKLMGLQLADAVASGFLFGVQLNQYGFTEDRYIRMLQPIIYEQQGRYLGYGIKLWPDEAGGWLKTQNHLQWLYEVYNFLK